MTVIGLIEHILESTGSTIVDLGSREIIINTTFKIFQKNFPIPEITTSPAALIPKMLPTADARDCPKKM